LLGYFSPYELLNIIKMKTIILALISIFTFLSCKKSDSNPPKNSKTFNAKVIADGIDCGKSVIIQFNQNAQNIPLNNTNNIFYEINLPDQYRVYNMDLNVTFRLPRPDELFPCTTQGPTFPLIFIEKVN